jgi:hypothetical protein
MRFGEKEATKSGGPSSYILLTLNRISAESRVLLTNFEGRLIVRPLYQALIASMLSHAWIVMRFGGVPASPVIDLAPPPADLMVAWAFGANSLA